MNNTLHKGPFPLHITQNDDSFVVITNQGNHYAKTFDPSAARLIAAAPDLLEALQDIADGGCFDQGPNCLGFVNMEREQMMSFARSVIAKAKGE